MMRGTAGGYKSSAEWSGSDFEHQSNMAEPASPLSLMNIYKDRI
jgi:hypothetical protein